MNPTQTPTEEGPHYWRLRHATKWTIVEVIKKIDGTFWFWIMTVQYSLPITNDSGEWGGKVPSPGETYTIPEISAWACEHNPSQINDPNDGIAAVTKRNRK